MLEAFVDLVMERRRQDPGMHVYHYGGYESGALKRLMQRHATREDEIDVLLRGHVLVNLYDHVVRQGIRASVESYSIKKLETFYMPRARGRDHPCRLLGGRVRALDGAAGSRDPRRDRRLQPRRLHLQPAAPRLARGSAAIEALATHPEWYPTGEVPRPGLGGRRARREGRRRAGRDPPPRGCAPRGRARRPGAARRRSSRAAGCSRRCSTGIGARRSRSGGTTTGWSRRRWTTSSRTARRWRGCGSSRTSADRPGRRSTATRSIRRRTRRSSRARRTSRCPRTRTAPAGTRPRRPSWRIDPLAGTIDLKRDGGEPAPRRAHPDEAVTARSRCAARSAARGPRDRARDRGPGAVPRGARPGPRAAAPDRGPRRRARRSSTDGADVTAVARSIAVRLDETVLAIQGPPGTGKTYTARADDPRPRRERPARRRHGAVAPGDREPARGRRARRRTRRAGASAIGPARRRATTTSRSPWGSSGIRRPRTIPGGLAAGQWDVVGGTSWVWAREDMAGARRRPVRRRGGPGVARHGVLRGRRRAVGRAAGRPEPAAAGLAGHAPRGRRGVRARAPRRRARRRSPPDRGLLLGTTYRLHPDVNAFISDAFYEGRLATAPGNERQHVGDGQPVGGTGIRFVPLVHAGASNRSREEAEWVAAAIDALVGRPLDRREGQRARRSASRTSSSSRRTTRRSRRSTGP